MGLKPGVELFAALTRKRAQHRARHCLPRICTCPGLSLDPCKEQALGKVMYMRRMQQPGLQGRAEQNQQRRQAISTMLHVLHCCRLQPHAIHRLGGSQVQQVSCCATPLCAQDQEPQELSSITGAHHHGHNRCVLGAGDWRMPRAVLCCCPLGTLRRAHCMVSRTPAARHSFSQRRSLSKR